MARLPTASISTPGQATYALTNSTIANNTAGRAGGYIEGVRQSFATSTIAPALLQSGSNVFLALMGIESLDDLVRSD
jgi:hypothetical protein